MRLKANLLSKAYYSFKCTRPLSTVLKKRDVLHGYKHLYDDSIDCLRIDNYKVFIKTTELQYSDQTFILKLQKFKLESLLGEKI